MTLLLHYQVEWVEEQLDVFSYVSRVMVVDKKVVQVSGSKK